MTQELSKHVFKKCRSSSKIRYISASIQTMWHVSLLHIFLKVIYLSSYEKTDPSSTVVTDFDLPTVYNEIEGRITPQSVQVIDNKKTNEIEIMN